MSTVVVTGASSGVGLAAAVQFAARGDDVVLVGRDPRRLEDAVAQVRAAGGGREPGRFRADFEVLAEVRELAAGLLAAYPRIDVLANNAGGILPARRLTTDGFEATVQGNHLAPFLLTGLLRERLAGGRVVTTASAAHRAGAPDPADLTGSGKYRAMRVYGQSKSANILFAAEAARRWPEVTSVSFHPGVVRTNFGSANPFYRLFYRYAPFLVTPEKAGELLVWLATTPDVVNGAYYEGRKPVEPHRHAAGPALAAALWEASAKAVAS